MHFFCAESKPNAGNAALHGPVTMGWLQRASPGPAGGGSVPAGGGDVMPPAGTGVSAVAVEMITASGSRGGSLRPLWQAANEITATAIARALALAPKGLMPPSVGDVRRRDQDLEDACAS